MLNIENFRRQVEKWKDLNCQTERLATSGSQVIVEPRQESHEWSVGGWLRSLLARLSGKYCLAKSLMLISNDVREVTRQWPELRGVLGKEELTLLREDLKDLRQKIGELLSYHFQHRSFLSSYTRSCWGTAQSRCNEAQLNISSLAGSIEVEKSSRNRSATQKEWLAHLRIAVSRGDLEKVNQLISETEGSFPDLASQPLVGWAVRRGNRELMRRLIRIGADVNCPGEGGAVPFEHAVRLGDLEMAEELLNVGAHVPTAVEGEPSLLHEMLYRQNNERVAYLLDKGMNTSIRDDLGNRALDIALQKGDDAMIRLVLRMKKKETGQRDQFGRTALHYVAQHPEFLQKRSILKELMRERAALELVDREGMTPLHCAAAAGNLGVVKLLLDKGVETGRKDLNGRTPYTLALLNHQDSVAEYLGSLEGS